VDVLHFVTGGVLFFPLHCVIVIFYTISLTGLNQHISENLEVETEFPYRVPC
jgi:hypothetical protein